MDNNFPSFWQRKFCISQGSKIDWVLFKIFNEKYRALKYRTKYKLYDVVKSRLDEANNIGVDEAQELEYTEEQILHALDLVDAPSNVEDHQWESFKAQLRSSKSRVMAFNLYSVFYISTKSLANIWYISLLI